MAGAEGFVVAQEQSGVSLQLLQGGQRRRGEGLRRDWVPVSRGREGMAGTFGAVVHHTVSGCWHDDAEPLKESVEDARVQSSR